MSKRFIDTLLFDDPWFMDLTKDAKLLWIYFITRCDHAGIIELNKRLVKFQTGIEDLPTVIKELSNRLVTVRQDLYFIPKFLFFQYPGFPKSQVKQQQGAIKILEKHNLMKDGILTVSKELTNSYDNGTDNDIVIVNEPDEKKLQKEIVNQYSQITYIARESKVTVEEINESIPEFIISLGATGKMNEPLNKQMEYFRLWSLKKFNNNGFKGNSKTSDRQRRRIGEQNYDGFKL